MKRSGAPVRVDPADVNVQYVTPPSSIHAPTIQDQTSTPITPTVTVETTTLDVHMALPQFPSPTQETWFRTIELSSGCGRAIVVSGDDIYLTGHFLTSGYDAFVAKITENSSLLWTDTFGGEDQDHGYEIVSNGEKVYVVGETRSFCGLSDAFLAEFSSNGTLEWMKILVGNTQNPFLTSI